MFILYYKIMSTNFNYSRRQPQYQLKDFLSNGVCIVDLREYILKDNVIKHIYDLNKIVESLPSELPVGGFAAYGDARTFHAPQVRALRILTIDTAFKLSQMFKKSHVELIVDRILFRRPGQNPSAESLHRDTTPTKRGKLAVSNVDDVITGGWINLSPQSQYFSCWPGTQNDLKALSQAPGFSKITDEETKRKFNMEKKKVEIPPYHMMVFNQLMIHEVLKTTSKNKPTQLRLFIGFRFTDSKEPIIPDIITRLKNGDLIPLKSGQMPSMYPKLYRNTFIDKTLELSLKLKDRLPPAYYEYITSRKSKKLVNKLVKNTPTLVSPYVESYNVNNVVTFKTPFPLLKFEGPSMVEAYNIRPNYNDAELYLYTPNVWTEEILEYLLPFLIKSINYDSYSLFKNITINDIRNNFKKGDKVQISFLGNTYEGKLTAINAYTIAINDVAYVPEYIQSIVSDTRSIYRPFPNF